MAQFLWKSKTAAQTQNLRIFGNFQKGNLPRNLPWSFPRTVLVLEPKSFLLMSFWWNNLNNKNIFFYFCRGPWKLRKWPKNLKTCCFGMFPKEFWKIYYRYSESWVESVWRICHQLSHATLYSGGKFSLKIDLF